MRLVLSDDDGTVIDLWDIKSSPEVFHDLTFADVGFVAREALYKALDALPKPDTLEEIDALEQQEGAES